MSARNVTPFAGLLLAIANTGQAAPVPTADPATAFKPTITLRLQPADQLLADARYVVGLMARLAPTEKEGKELLAAIDANVDLFFGPDWRKAIDTSRPILAYATVEANFAASTGAVLIPVRDPGAFRALLERLMTKVEDDNGMLRFSMPGVKPSHGGQPAAGYARFANQYAYLTVNDAAVVALNRIPTPAQVSANDPAAALSATLYLDRVPEQFRQAAVGGVQQFKALLHGEPGPRGSFGIGMAELMILAGPLFQLYPLAEPAVRDGREFTLNLKFDRKRLDLLAELTLTARSGSELARLTSSIRPPTSLFPQMLGDDAAVRGLVRATIPDDLRKAFLPKLEAGLGRAPNDVPVWGALAGKLGEKLLPTLQEGEIDIAGALRGPFKGDRYGIVAGLRLKDAAAVEQALRDAVKALPKEARDVIKLGAMTDGGMRVHKVQLPPLPEPAGAIFGESTVYVAFRPDAVVAAFGEHAVDGLRAAFAAKPQPCIHYMLEASGRKLVPLVTRIDAEAGKKFKSFLGDDVDRVPLAEIAVEGGAALKVRYGNGLTTLLPAMFFFAVTRDAAPFQPGAPVPAVPPPPPPKPLRKDGF